MSVFFKRAEQRSISYQDLWSTGQSVDNLTGNSIDAALRLVPVYAATSLIADMFASSPWAVFEDSTGVPKRVDGVQLVEDPGTGGLDLYSWKFQLLASDLLRGNAYGQILDTDRRGVPSKVQWLKPDDCDIEGNKFFWQGRPIDASELIHIPAYVLPGSRKGLSPIGLFRMQIETAMQAQSFGKNFFRRGTTPPGVLKNNDKALTPEQATIMKSRFLASVSSSEPFVTGADWDYTAITVPAGEVSFLTGIKASANQIAAAFRVAPEDVGGESGGSTLKYASLEMDQLKFNTRTLRPWASRVEAVVNRYLPTGQYVKFNLDAIVRSDLKTRYEAHGIAIQNHFKTEDEVRLLEELPPLTQQQRDNFPAPIPAPSAQK